MTLVTLGETLMLLRPAAVGPMELAADLAVGVGGAESNVAIGVARLGGRSTWIGRVGDDGPGLRVLRELRGEQVEVRARTCRERRTGLMFKETRIAGASEVTYYRRFSAGSTLGPEDVDPHMIEAASLLHITGITPALSTSCAEAVELAVDTAVNADVPVSFDVNYRSSLWKTRDPRPVFRTLASRATIVFAGREEAALIVGDGAPSDLARRVAEMGPRHTLLKLGAQGCISVVDGVESRVPALAVDAVDTVGAGDAFAAGYLHGLIAGLPARDCLELARRCGAFACLGLGDWETFPRQNDLGLLDAADERVQR